MLRNGDGVQFSSTLTNDNNPRPSQTPTASSPLLNRAVVLLAGTMGTPSPSSSSHSVLSHGAIVGISIGCVITVLATVAAVVLFYIQRRGRREFRPSVQPYYLSPDLSPTGDRLNGVPRKSDSVFPNIQYPSPLQSPSTSPPADSQPSTATGYTIITGPSGNLEYPPAIQSAMSSTFPLLERPPQSRIEQTEKAVKPPPRPFRPLPPIPQISPRTNSSRRHISIISPVKQVMGLAFSSSSSGLPSSPSTSHRPPSGGQRSWVMGIVPRFSANFSTSETPRTVDEHEYQPQSTDSFTRRSSSVGQAILSGNYFFA